LLYDDDQLRRAELQLDAQWINGVASCAAKT
jgi:hypothetical protein